MISSSLLPMLSAQFSDRPMQITLGAAPVAVFLAIHPDVGNLEIYDDGDELTLVVGNFTHTHFGNYDEGISESERAKRIAEALVAFLQDLFADRVEMFGTHSGGGGTRYREAGKRGILCRTLFGRRSYVWSGPLTD